MEDKVLILKNELLELGKEEGALRTRIKQLKEMVAEKARRTESLAALKREEAELLALLG
jgi:cell shape-determining protein MreC